MTRRRRYGQLYRPKRGKSCCPCPQDVYRKSRSSGVGELGQLSPLGSPGTNRLTEGDTVPVVSSTVGSRVLRR